MTPPSRTDWPTGSPRACSGSSTATSGRRAAPPRRGKLAGRGPRGVAALAGLAALTLALAACAYFNTFYNARQAYEEGVRRSAVEGETLTPATRAAFQKAIEKSAVVLDRHPDSAYVDDALLLMGRSFMALGRYVDAAVTLRRLVDRFPDSALAPTARIELVRSLRLGEDYVAAQAAMGLVRENPEGIDPSDILYERALIALGRGEHEQAFDLLRELLREDPGYAREHRVALRFADEELEAGRYDAAVDAYRTYRDETADPAREEEVTLKIARALARAGREREAIAAYEDLLAGALPDTVQARIYAERGALYAELERWDDATADLKRAAELAPGTLTASQATLGRARIAWRVRGQREAALEVFLDAFLHAPRSAFADSARTSARAVARILHFQRLADGGVVVAGLDDPALVRSTALYRLAEEVRESEKDPEGSVEIFDSLIERFPDSPWTPRALLASGLLLRETGATDEGNARLERLIGTRPDDPAADSARLLLGEPLPERPEHFYDESQELERLVAALPDLQDPMVAIADQMDRYVTRQEPAIRGGLNRGLDRPTGGNATGAEPVPPRQEPLPGDRELPPGVTP